MFSLRTRPSCSLTFLCRPDDEGVSAPPIPAKSHLPDWFRKLPAVSRDQASPDNNGLTVKRCMPFLEGTRPKTGTSFAAPFVTAAAALAKSRGVAIDDIAGVLTRDAEDLGDPGKDPIFGWGLLNASKLCSG